MNDESVSKSCPQCGAAVPGDAPGGLCPKCLMVQAAASTGGDGLPPESKAPPSLEAVRAAFPQLEIQELIGQGGMAAVFKARQPKLNRLVALKILPERLAADPAFAERFAREGQMLARLSHPNIVAIHDFGESAGFYYLLMEYVDGVNLRQAMRSGGFTPQQALSIVPKICEALQYAHDEGVLHRDIKPENILLDTKGRVKIADFGIAKLAKEATAAERLTGEGTALGTPHYMAPEQIEQPSDVDHRADIYSLGVVFYELLTGELPLGRFAPPSEKAAVDPRVDDVVFKALERERERRQQSAREVKTQVETITSDGRNATALVPGAHSSQRFRMIVALVGVPVVLIVGLVGTYLISWERGPFVTASCLLLVGMFAAYLIVWAFGAMPTEDVETDDLAEPEPFAADARSKLTSSLACPTGPKVPPSRESSLTWQWMTSLLGPVILCSPAAMLVWFLLIGYRVCGINPDSDEEIWIGLIGFPAAGGAGIALTWLLGSFRRRDTEMLTDVPQRWSAWAIVGMILLLFSTLLMGGGLVVAALLREELGNWHPALAELVFTVAFLGGGVLASALATLAGWLACREIQRASPPMRGWQAACVAAWFWPGVAVGLLLLSAMTLGYDRLAVRSVFLMVAAVGLAAFSLIAAIRRLRRTPTAGTVNPWPGRVFWLMVLILVVPLPLFVVMLLTPRFAAYAPPPHTFGPRGGVRLDNVMAVEDLLTLDLSVILDPPHPELRLCYLGQPLKVSRVASVPKPASGVVLGPAAELQEGAGQYTWQLGVRETGPTNLSTCLVLVLPDRNAASEAAKRLQSLASEEGYSHILRDSKLQLFTLDSTPQGPYAAWLELPSGPQGTAIVVNRQPDVDALRAKHPKVDGNVLVPYGYVAEFDVVLRKGESERHLPELSFFAAHDDPQRRQELLSLPVSWSLIPNERARGPVIGHLRAGNDLRSSIDVWHEVPETEVVAWKMSPGYLTDEALIEGLRDLSPCRWLDPIGPLGPGKTNTSRLFYGEPKLPRDRPVGESSLAIMLRVSVHRLPADRHPRPGIHVKAGTPWRQHLDLPAEEQEVP